MNSYELLKQQLKETSRLWLVTGAAGFIGSNLLETLLTLDQRVVGLDNFSTGHRRNLAEVQARVHADRWGRFSMMEGDIRDYETCRRACDGVDFVLHQAALGSVPRSIENPLGSHEANVSGFVNMLSAARESAVARFVYASSSAVYGSNPALPKVEDCVGDPLSPYAATKLANELYAAAFKRCYGLESIGLRYFNVFGPRQDPAGAYAAVIPRWIAAMVDGKLVEIFGDGESTRDFCFVENVVQANLLAATAPLPIDTKAVFNVAVGEQTSLTQLFWLIREKLDRKLPASQANGNAKVTYRDFRLGDVRHSLAETKRAKQVLGYEPTHRLSDGLEVMLDWYLKANKAITAAATAVPATPQTVV